MNCDISQLSPSIDIFAHMLDTKCKNCPQDFVNTTSYFVEYIHNSTRLYIYTEQIFTSSQLLRFRKSEVPKTKIVAS